MASEIALADLKDLLTVHAQQDDHEQQFIDDVMRILDANEIKSVKLLAKSCPSKIMSVSSGPRLTEGKRSFLSGVIETLQKPPPTATERNAINIDEVLTRVCEAHAPPVKKLVEIDMGTKMQEAGLSDLFPLDAWPAITPVRQLATWQQAKKKHVGSELVYIEIKKFLPSYCADCISLDIEVLESDAPAPKDMAKNKLWKLDFASWIIGYDR